MHDVCGGTKSDSCSLCTRSGMKVSICADVFDSAKVNGKVFNKKFVDESDSMDVEEIMEWGSSDECEVANVGEVDETESLFMEWEVEVVDMIDELSLIAIEEIVEMDGSVGGG